jgi:8-oxo-dGTP pyrophosphatase MutT (NUDIX family)
VRPMRGRVWIAAIRPGGKPEGVWALPKGIVHRNEDPEATAVREVAEETGCRGESLGKLGDVRYVYTLHGQRVFKIVSFYLVRYAGGRIGEVPPAFRKEVEEARWLPLDNAPKLLAYKGEREMAEAAITRLGEAAL